MIDLFTNLKNITVENLIEEASKLKEQGCRFAALTCEQVGELVELTYHFDVDYEMIHLRLELPLKGTLPSISPLFPSAFLIENEYQDLFGLSFTDLTVDYKGRLYLAENGPKTPLIK